MDWNLFGAIVVILLSLGIGAVLLYIAGVFKKDTPPSPQPHLLQTVGEINGKLLFVRYGMMYADIAPSDVHVLISTSNGSTTQTIAKGTIVKGQATLPLTGTIPSSLDFTVTLSGGMNISATDTAVSY